MEALMAENLSSAASDQGTGVEEARAHAGPPCGNARPDADRRHGEDAAGPPDGWVPVFALAAADNRVRRAG
jgi:hypothetical protein